MDSDGYAHTGDVIMEDGKPKEHVMSTDCWCQPIRHRYNMLSQQWEIWNRVEQWWDVMDPQPPAPRDAPIYRPKTEKSPVERQEDRDADREAGRYEDRVKRDW